MLTRKQHELLVFINERIAETGVSPSFEEMKDALDLRSKSGVHRLVTGLEERGFIRRLAHKARALEVMRMPTDAAFNDRGVQGERPAQRKKPLMPTGPEAAGAAQIPLQGRIAAGTPIEAINETSAYVAAPREILGRGEHYALEIAGDSMIGDGIMDGDTVIIEENADYSNNDIVVALVREEEATLKRIERQSSRIILRASNPDYPPQEHSARDVRVQGRLVGLIRRY